MIFEHGMISKERDAKTEKELAKYFKEQLPHRDDYDGWEKRWKEHNNHELRKESFDYIYKTMGELETYFRDGYGRFHNEENRTKALSGIEFMLGLYI